MSLIFSVLLAPSMGCKGGVGRGKTERRPPWKSPFPNTTEEVKFNMWAGWNSYKSKGTVNNGSLLFQAFGFTFKPSSGGGRGVGK